MTNRTAATFLIPSALAASACSDAATNVLPDAYTPAGIGFSVDREDYGSADTVVLTLTNNSEQGVGSNLCFATLQRREDGRWYHVTRSRPDLPCASALWILPPGRSAVELQPVSPYLEAGVYRFVDEIEWPLDGESVNITSNGFRVTG